MEEIQTRDGLITNASFTDYLIPTALDMPPVESVLVEEPEPDAPYGVKGVGEPPTVVSTAAIVSALRDATGRDADARAGAAGRHRRPDLVAAEHGGDLRVALLAPQPLGEEGLDDRGTRRRAPGRRSPSAASAAQGPLERRRRRQIVRECVVGGVDGAHGLVREREQQEALRAAARRPT